MDESELMKNVRKLFTELCRTKIHDLCVPDDRYACAEKRESIYHSKPILILQVRGYSWFQPLSWHCTNYLVHKFSLLENQ